MTTVSNFPEDLVGEILSRVPLTSLSKVRCTCKTWNALSKTQILGKETARKHVLGFMVIDSRVCSLRFDLQGILNERSVGDPSINQIRILDHIEMSEVIIHSDGLLLCVVKDKRKLMVWNPYLGQERWIRRPRKFRAQDDMFALGYDDNNKNNRNHKILRILEEHDNNNINFTIHLGIARLKIGLDLRN